MSDEPASTDQLKEKLFGKIFEDLIKNLVVEFDDGVYISGEKVGDMLTQLFIETLQEEEVREMLRCKIREAVADIDPKKIAEAVEKEIKPGFFRRLFGT